MTLALAILATITSVADLRSALTDNTCFGEPFEIRATVGLCCDHRQRVIVDSITRGLSNGEIATLLGISRTRVKQHLTEVFETLGAANRAEVAAIAIRRQLLKR